MIKPNTFIIGAQKSATTSLYNWLAQHPDVCGPYSLKDFPLFIEGDFSSITISSLDKEYLKEGYSNQKIILQACVQYMFEEKAIDNIFRYDSESKLICVLRNPIERAISAYNYFKKLNLENLSFKSALDLEDERMKGPIRHVYDFTYKAHGLYAQQLEKVFKKFKKEQVLILFYEDLKDNPELTIKKAFQFLKIDDSFTPEFRRLNVTGKVRFKFLQSILFNGNRFQKIIVNKLVNPILPVHKRNRLRLSLSEWNTKKKVATFNKEDFKEEKQILKNYFKEDLVKLEKITGRNLSAWK